MKGWFTREHVGWAGGLTLLMAILAVASVVIANSAAESAAKSAADSARTETLRIAAAQLRGGCARNQLNRAWQRVRAREAPSAKRADFNQENAAAYFRITNCEATYAAGYTGPAVYLEPKLDECFVRLTEEGFWRDKEPFTNPIVLRDICRTE